MFARVYDNITKGNIGEAPWITPGDNNRAYHGFRRHFDELGKHLLK